jgi:hypothetical protein
MDCFEAEGGALFLEDGDRVTIIGDDGGEVSVSIAEVLAYVNWRAGRSESGDDDPECDTIRP